MSGMTMIEKILSAHTGQRAAAGDIVVSPVDAALALDASGPLTLDYYEAMGGTGVFDPQKIIMVMDHYVPCANAAVSRLQDRVREFHRKGNCVLYDLGEGICHHIMPEKGHVKPGTVVVGADSHSITYGAFNCLGTGLGSSDMAAAMITGSVWLRVPECFKVTLRGALPPAVEAKDVALRILGLLGADGAAYKALEFSGDGIGGLSVYERMTICNMMVECGAKAAIMPCDQVLRDRFPGETLNAVSADPDAVYEREVEIALSSLEPLIAVPHSPDSVVPLKDVAGTPIHMGVIGTCTNSSPQDMQRALDVMGDKHIVPGFELILVPATRAIYAAAAREGILERFVMKGAYVLPPGCGPCCGSSAGIPSDGENVLSTANRNFLGRMGNVNAAIYLGSPSSVAAAAITGVITHPLEALS
ncbi:3-isopropylmalate dehydratase large subunit [Deltaproteobacteria bacterium]|nr:3-isopropylmalate dehydratase large subunit [Deltaproteobacteria bacterium]